MWSEEGWQSPNQVGPKGGEEKGQNKPPGRSGRQTGGNRGQRGWMYSYGSSREAPAHPNQTCCFVYWGSACV